MFYFVIKYIFGLMSTTGPQVQPAAKDPCGHHASFQCDKERNQHNP